MEFFVFVTKENMEPKLVMFPKLMLPLLSLALTFSVIQSAEAEEEKTIKSKELSTAFARLIGDMVIEHKEFARDAWAC